MMLDLVERVELALKHLGNNPWLPELTADLVEPVWLKLYSKIGLSPHTYGTARAIIRDAGAPRRIVARLPIFAGAESLNRAVHVEILEEEFIRNYDEAGVRFYTAAEINALNVLAQLREAITVLKSVPTLLTTIAALVRSIHVLDAGDDDYDVSFSEPHIPFSIFVSVPQASNAISGLRVAEAIVHEAMHLQLTLIEQIVPLVRRTSQRHYSPWRGEFRTTQGVLHGLYVFRVIDMFFYVLQSLPLCESNVIDYIKRRRSEIYDQVSSIHSLQDSEDLTEIGIAFACRMMSDLE